jgi:hypothetical protein
MHQGERLLFGVTGALYNSAAVLYDRRTESLWAQPIRKAIAGELMGATLSVIPSVRTRWSSWLKEHPDSFVLSPRTGHIRNYDLNPYAEYQGNSEVAFPVRRKKVDCRLHAKEWVLGIELEGKFRAYPLRALKKSSRITDRIGSRQVELTYDPKSSSGQAALEDGSPHPVVQIYWFAWNAFHPETDCYSPEK